MSGTATAPVTKTEPETITEEDKGRWKPGKVEIAVMIFAMTLPFIGGGVMVGINLNHWLSSEMLTPFISTLLFMMSSLIGYALVWLVDYRSRQQEKADNAQRIEKAERKVEAHPNEVKPVWELAQIRLTGYLDRNLNQVRSIYWLTIAIMIIGFGFIGIGVFRVYSDPEALQASVLSAVSGLLVNFIGATFLVIYRSTMNQAKEYVTVLERINAVGMAMQILDKLENSAQPEIKDKTTSDIARELIKMYSTNPAN